MHTENSENGWYNRHNPDAPVESRAERERREAGRGYWQAKDAHDRAIENADYETARRLREQHRTNF